MERSAQHAVVDAWTVSDGRAGNARQANALAGALGIHAREWALAPRAPWRWLAPRKLPGAAHAFGDAFEQALRQPPALAIGCGRQAALATRVLRARGARVVQVLDPRLPTAHWDLVVAPLHDALRGDNVIALLGSLNPVDDAWLARARNAFATFSALPRPRIGLLLGGPTTHARFRAHEMLDWVARVEAVAAREGGSLLLAASRRTPAEVRARLRARRPQAAGLQWLDAGDGANPYPGILAWADRLACTADSVNMLSEACATWAPVYVPEPGLVQGRVRDFVATLLDGRRIRPLDDAMARHEVAPLRETARVAAEIAGRLQLA